MDMIEYTMHSLARQARGISELVPNPPVTRRLLSKAADVLEEAAGERHSARNSGEMSLEDDTRDAQRAQIATVEKEIGLPIHCEPGPGPPADDPLSDRPISALSTEEMFEVWGRVMRELKERGAIRSTNRPPVGDYAETLAAAALRAERPEGPDRGVDLVRDGIRYQVKARLDPPGGTATHFDIASLDEDRFDVFVGIVLDEYFQVRAAWTVDREVLRSLALPAGAKHRVKIREIDGSCSGGRPGVAALEL